MKFRFINGHQHEYNEATMCRVLKVARAGFYPWLHQPDTNRAIEDLRLLGLIRDSYVASGDVYGSPRVFADLPEAGETCGKHRVERIIRHHKIHGVHGYKSPKAVKGRPSILARNRVNREITVDTPYCVWLTDINYIRTWQGWLYLAVVLDLHSRAVLGWSMQPTIVKELVLDALMMAVWRRKPNQELIVHSNQGSQYRSDDWKRFCDANKLLPSMNLIGNCWDNSVAESFISSLEKERIRKRTYKTRDLARADVFDYIEAFYNRRIRHSHLGGVSTEAFECALFCGSSLSIVAWKVHRAGFSDSLLSASWGEVTCVG